MMLNDRQERIILAALVELDIRLRRGLANSGLDKATADILRLSPHIHDSEIISLRQRFESGR